MKRRTFLLTTVLFCSGAAGADLPPAPAPSRVRDTWPAARTQSRNPLVIRAAARFRMSRQTVTQAMMLSYGEAHDIWLPVAALPDSGEFRQTVEWRAQGRTGAYCNIQYDGKFGMRLGPDRTPVK